MGRGEGRLDAGSLASTQRHRDLAALPVIAHHGDRGCLRSGAGATFSLASQSSACCDQLADRSAAPCAMSTVPGLGQRAAELGLEVGGQKPVGAEHAGGRRDQHAC